VQCFATEVTLDVEVEITDASRGTPGRLFDRPERAVAAEPDACEIAVWLVYGDRRLELTSFLPTETLDALREDALSELLDDGP